MKKKITAILRKAINKYEILYDLFVILNLYKLSVEKNKKIKYLL